MGNSPYSIIVGEANFAKEVIEKSKQVPVLVDFWAEWCAPCKILIPVLDKLVNEYQGKFILAKVNTDEEQRLAGQHGIRSIPTLKLFRYGKVVDEVMGAQSESALRTMIDRHRDRPADKLRLQAAALHAAGDSAKAIELLEQARGLEPNYPTIIFDLVDVFIDLKRIDDAKELLKTLPANAQGSSEFSLLSARLDFAQIAIKAPTITVLEQAVTENPDNHYARYQLSAQYVLAEKFEAAMEHLLELMRRARDFEDGAGRKGLLAVFTLLGNQGPLVNRYRSRLSSLLH